MFDETPRQIEERSEFSKLEVPNFTCDIPETALSKLSPEIAELMRIESVNVQYSKWQCEALCQINAQVRKTNGRVISLEKSRNECDEDHEKTEKMFRSYQMVNDWKVLVILCFGVFGGVFQMIQAVYPYVIK